MHSLRATWPRGISTSAVWLSRVFLGDCLRNSFLPKPNSKSTGLNRTTTLSYLPKYV